MSHPHTSADPSDPHGIRVSADGTGLLLTVFAAVVALSLANIGLSTSIGPGKFTLPMQLLIGTIQAGLVAYYFMHLRHGDKVVILTALSSLFWMGIMFVLFLGDYMTRQYVVTG
ncbi:cytochrome C oxidase subunit IV family protein [Gemmata sp. JC673]|uniref:Cytochrome C oxidase subunit IV family protein n=1 Tax=Gemmata algarum TaxID=2975278 RepID=A0ABU5F418_9BACT|nr:cytochrome C oxidase subunit IV family protein [Gemmata algarum]MDY3562300.1 cytochrome C oxidase subunit IV family protein [Gemmata algarum]